jgi:hypothetical protein
MTASASPRVRLDRSAIAGTPTGFDVRPLLVSQARGYFASDGARVLQTWLGVLWLLDGALQFQPFMYGSGFVQMVNGMATGQPTWLGDTITWAAGTLQAHQVVLNTAFALIQVGLGLGLLYRRTVKPALVVSFVWALIVWWLAEGFGMLFMSMNNPISGAPGAAILYALAAALAWPGARPGGMLGVRGARLAWGVLWLLMAYLWLTPPGTNANMVSEAIDGAPAGMSWLVSVQSWFAAATRGDGLVLGLMFAIVSATIGVAVARNWRPRPFLALAVAINLGFWVLGQGFGGIFAGGATDPNSGPLFVLLAYAMYSLVGLPSAAAVS